jgi:hypothetical protein
VCRGVSRCLSRWRRLKFFINCLRQRRRRLEKSLKFFSHQRRRRLTPLYVWTKIFVFRFRLEIFKSGFFFLALHQKCEDHKFFLSLFVRNFEYQINDLEIHKYNHHHYNFHDYLDRHIADRRFGLRHYNVHERNINQIFIVDQRKCIVLWTEISRKLKK